MKYLSLQIDGQWAHLAEGTEIALEGNNPIFSDAGSKTYLFQLHVDSNRHLFGNSDEIFGDSYYKVIDGKPATLYVAGIPIMVGKVSLEDEVYMDDEGCVAINLVSGNLEFAQMIEGMNCRDVELLDEIEIGHTYDKAEFVVESNRDLLYHQNRYQKLTHTFDLPGEFITFDKENPQSNVAMPYPERPYCNIRVCYRPSDKSVLSSAVNDHPNFKDRDILDVKGELAVLGVNRHNSGPCFYLLYFLDCLFKKLRIAVDENRLFAIEDAKRIAFVNLNCFIEAKGEEWVSSGDIVDDIPGFEWIWDTSTWRQWFYQKFAPVWLAGERRYRRRRAFATSENFPDEDVKKVVESIESLFGARLLFDSQSNRLSIVLLKDIMLSDKVVPISAIILDSVKVENKVKGFRLTYGNESEDDVQHNNVDFSNIRSVSQYIQALRNISSFDKSRYIDTRNGNAYLVAVESEANEKGDVKRLFPSLFEAGAFADALYGDCSEESYTETITMPFSPIVNNDIDGPNNESIAKKESNATDGKLSNTYALFVDEEIDARWSEYSEKYVDPLTSLKNGDTFDFKDTNYTLGIKYLDYLGSNSGVVGKIIRWNTHYNKGVFPADTPPIVNSYDVGFMLGIMRGPGNAAGIEYFDENFDGEGNSRVAFTSANYAFTSDSVDNCDRDFDYNGKEEGGVDYDSRISLKLRAGKYDQDGNPIKDENGNPIVLDADRANRGLFDKFWKEYAYFTVNKKIVRLRLRMEIADLVNLDWTKRYKIGDYIGFIANWNVNVNNKGVGEIEMDMYYI